MVTDELHEQKIVIFFYIILFKITKIFKIYQVAKNLLRKPPLSVHRYLFHFRRDRNYNRLMSQKITQKTS